MNRSGPGCACWPTACSIKGAGTQRIGAEKSHCLLVAGLIIAFSFCAQSAFAAPPERQAVIPIDDRSAEQLFEAAKRTQLGSERSADIALAVSLYARAAELGSADAAFSLGNLYLLGEGVVANEQRALEYYRQAANQGHALAARNLRELERAVRGEGIASETPAQKAAQATPIPPDLSSDEQRAIELAFSLGMTIDFGDSDVYQAPHPESAADNTSVDDSSAGDNVAGESAASAKTITEHHILPGTGRIDSVSEQDYRLAERYFHGDGLEKDEAMAITLYRAAAQRGHPIARRRLLAIYRSAGLPLPQFPGEHSETPPSQDDD